MTARRILRRVLLAALLCVLLASAALAVETPTVDSIEDAQANLEKGGSWYGSVQNLRHGWSHVAVFRDGSEAAERLIQMGAIPVSLEDLKDFALLAQPEQNFLI